jgi:hypothetical protein
MPIQGRWETKVKTRNPNVMVPCDMPGFPSAWLLHPPGKLAHGAPVRWFPVQGQRGRSAWRMCCRQMLRRLHALLRRPAQ